MFLFFQKEEVWLSPENYVEKTDVMWCVTPKLLILKKHYGITSNVVYSHKKKIKNMLTLKKFYRNPTFSSKTPLS